METFEGMYDKELSMSMAKRNALGFADVVVRQLSQTQASPSTADLLAQRHNVNTLVAPAMPLHKPVLPMSLQQPVQAAMPLERQTLKPLRLDQAMPLTPVRNEP
jgi:Rod binding domain-containing protein